MSRRDRLTEAANYINSWLGYQMSRLEIPGLQCALVHDGDVLLSATHGFADVERGESLSANHQFRVASHSKMFTGLAVLRLRDLGKLRLEDAAGLFLPWLSRSESPSLADVTVEQLLSHNGGVLRDGLNADFWQGSFPFPSLDELTDVFGSEGQTFPPGTRVKYSNLAFGLLGAIVEAAAETSYDEFVRSQIIEPLQLQSTGAEPDPEGFTDLVTGYSARHATGKRLPLHHVNTAAMAAATGFYSTALDLCRFADALCRPSSQFNEDSVRQMRNELARFDTELAYGLGLMIFGGGENKSFGHNGGFPGQSTQTRFDPDLGVSISVLTNATEGNADQLVAASLELARFAVSRGRERTDKSLDRFCGRFANLWTVLDVVRFGTRLFAFEVEEADPTKQFFELEPEQDGTVRVTRGPSTTSIGERWNYRFDHDGVQHVRANGAMTFLPIDTYRRLIADSSEFSWPLAKGESI